MSRKQFLTLLVALVVLAAAGAGVLWSDRSAWTRGDTRLGEKLLPALKAAEVAEIAIRSAQSEVHVLKSGAGWKVRERGDFPADPNLVSTLLLKLIELKVVQTEVVSDAQRARLQLVEPKPGAVPVAAAAKEAKADAKGDVKADAKGDVKADAKADAKVDTKADTKVGTNVDTTTGTVFELKDAGGKVLGRLLLGKTLTKQSDASGEPDVPAGRYIIVGEHASGIAVVADPLKDADVNPSFWLDKDVMRADSVKSVTASGPDGNQKWSLSRAKEGDLMSFAGSSEKPDPQKGQDTISAFYGITLLDVVADPVKTATGLDKPLTVTAQSFDGVTYVLKIGTKAGEDRYYAAVSSSGVPSKTREPGKGESAEDKTKRDKEFEENYKNRLERRERDRMMEKWAYIVPKTSIDAIMRDRLQLMPEKKEEPKKK